MGSSGCGVGGRSSSVFRSRCVGGVDRHGLAWPQNACAAPARDRKRTKGYRRKACNPSIFLVGRTGFEPVTNGLKVRESPDSFTLIDFHVHAETPVLKGLARWRKEFEIDRNGSNSLGFAYMVPTQID